MAVEGKLRSLFVALDTLGHPTGVTFRPLNRVELQESQCRDLSNQLLGQACELKCSRIEVGIDQVSSERGQLKARPTVDVS